MIEHNILRFLHSRFGALLMMAVAVAATIVSYCMGNIENIPGDTGLWLPSANDWLPAGAGSLTAGLFLNIGIAALLVLLNKRYNIIRSSSDLFARLFLILQMSLPTLMGQFYGGTLLCVIVLLSVFILYASFSRPFPRQPIFLIFFLLALGSMTQYAYAFYLPVFLLGCAQMRIFDGKTFIAALLGIITPVWSMWGFGFISFSEFEMPHFVNIFTAIDSDEMLQMLVTVGLTLILLIVFSILNLVRVLNYNSKTRAYNGFITILSLVTAILVLIDYTNLDIYVPLLNCCAAFQVGHYFAINSYQRSYIIILSLIAVYMGLYWWNAML